MLGFHDWLALCEGNESDLQDQLGMNRREGGGAVRFAVGDISMLALSIVFVFASRVPITFTV